MIRLVAPIRCAAALTSTAAIVLPFPIDPLCSDPLSLRPLPVEPRGGCHGHGHGHGLGEPIAAPFMHSFVVADGSAGWDHATANSEMARWDDQWLRGRRHRDATRRSAGLPSLPATPPGPCTRLCKHAPASCAQFSDHLNRSATAPLRSVLTLRCAFFLLSAIQPLGPHRLTGGGPMSAPRLDVAHAVAAHVQVCAQRGGGR